jgi:hypothetical protein
VPLGIEIGDLLVPLGALNLRDIRDATDDRGPVHPEPVGDHLAFVVRRIVPAQAFNLFVTQLRHYATRNMM